MAVEGAPWMLCLCYPLAASPSSEAIYSHHSHALSAWIGYGRRIQNFKSTEVACCRELLFLLERFEFQGVKCLF